LKNDTNGNVTHLLLFLGRDRLPGVADRPNLGYTEAVMHESMRLATVGPTGLFHESSCDSEICKSTIDEILVSLCYNVNNL
jgi:hypothetical protein